MKVAYLLSHCRASAESAAEAHEDIGIDESGVFRDLA